MNCPKNGIVRRLRRYRCRKCGYNYIIEKRSGECSKKIKRKALQLYLEGLGFRSRGRILGVINELDKNFLKELQNDNDSIEFAELDKIHSYIGNKKILLDMDCC